jgi:outer membrane protein OmpA-like peptidoglycan-associated protein/tetratricopeptide (TPR) repeat protein
MVLLIITAVFAIMPLAVSRAQEVLPEGASKKTWKSFQSALTAFREGEFDKCVRLSEAVVEDSPAFADGYILYGDCLLETGSLEGAARSYRLAMQFRPESPVVVMGLLANTLFRMEEYAEAASWYDSLISLPVNPELSKTYWKRREICLFRQEAMEHPLDYNPVNLGTGINTSAEEYVNAISTEEKSIVFTRRYLAEDPAAAPVKERLVEDFFSSSQLDSSWQPAVRLGYPVTTEGDAGGICYSPDGRFLFFTACFRPDSRGSCDLYYSERIGGQWSQPRNMGELVNSDHWDSQPSLSPDGRTLYFASNRVGSIGSSDIWKTELDFSGNWARPVNLGRPVNTSEAEMAPFMHYDNTTLYFSSSGHLGMGGSDLYKTTREARGWSVPQNLGYPLNTGKDELVIVINPQGTIGYYSAELPGGQGKYDIYRFEVPPEVRPVAVTYLKGTVIDAMTGKPLSAHFELFDISGNSLVIKSESDPVDGGFLICIPANRDYALNVSRTGYLFYSDHFALLENQRPGEPYLKDIRLSPVTQGEVTVLRNIFFKTDEYELKAESEVELKKIVDFLASNPGLDIEIGGHTDNTGTVEHNEWLSSERARAVYDFLIGQGVNAERLSYKGYGFSVPVASNETEEGRSLNRRTEMKIVTVSH